MKIEFSTEGTAFESPYFDDDWSHEAHKRMEIMRILKKIHDDVDNMTKTNGTIIDINGNKIGEWSM